MTEHTEDESVVWSLQREMIELPEVLRFQYDGEPVSKARARFTGRGSKTRAYTPEKTRAAEERIGWLARQAGATTPDTESSFGLFVALFCGTWQRRDVDNMVKLVSDGLTGIVWQDDSQVTEIAAKVQRGAEEPRTHVLIYRTLTQAPPHLPCETCGEPVRQYKSQPNRYCSKDCSHRGRRRRVEVTCDTCGKTMERIPSAVMDHAFCSPPCRSAWMKGGRK